MMKRDSLTHAVKLEVDRGKLLRVTLRKRWKLGATCAGGKEVRSAALRSRTEPPGGSLTAVDRPSRARTWTSLPSCSAVINKRGEEVEGLEHRAAAREPRPVAGFGACRARRWGGRADAAAVVRPFHTLVVPSRIGPWWVGEKQKWWAGLIVCVLCPASKLCHSPYPSTA